MNNEEHLKKSISKKKWTKKRIFKNTEKQSRSWVRLGNTSNVVVTLFLCFKILTHSREEWSQREHLQEQEQVQQGWWQREQGQERHQQQADRAWRGRHEQQRP